MTQVFSLSRIQHLFSKYYIENWKKDLKNFLVLFLLTAFFAGMETRNVMPYFAFVIMIMLDSSSLFTKYNYKAESFDSLLLPASTIEKLSVNFIIIYIYKILLYAVGIIAGLKLGGCIYYYLIWSDALPVMSMNEILSFISFKSLLSCFIFQGIFVYGALFFKKSSVIKTILTVFGIAVVIFMVRYFLIYLSFPSIEERTLFSITTIEGNLSIDSFMLTTPVKIIMTVFPILIFILIWIMNYLRLKEMEA